jgi:DNA repair protein RadD
MELRDYQRESVDATWRYLKNMPGASPVIVLPTGAGKSIVIAELARRVVKCKGRVMVLAHRGELLQQNSEKIEKLTGQRVGIYSASLRSRDTDPSIVCAGIQSCYRKAGEFGSRQLVLIDEAHLVNVEDAGMYRQFLGELQAINPECRLVGLTATPYRTGQGEIVGEESLFSGISYEAPVARLIEQGYLSPLRAKAGDASVDTSGLAVKRGEFVAADMEAAFSHIEVAKSAVAEVVARSTGRKSVLVFAAGVGHAELVRRLIEETTGERCGIVTGSTPQLERGAAITDFRNYRLRWLVNCNVLTTGFDAPGIDCIAVLRATCSPGLFAQICGRGFRLAEGKTDCLVLDFGENVQRHGALDDPNYGKAKKAPSEGGAVEKTCEECGEVSPGGCRYCVHCGAEFPVDEEKTKHGATAGDQELLASMAEPVVWYVDSIRYSLHVKKANGSRTLRVDYSCVREHCDMIKTISEWQGIEHEGIYGDRCRKWWSKRCCVQPANIEQAVEFARKGGVADVRSITVIQEGKWPRIIDAALDERPPRDDWFELRDEPEEVIASDFFGDDVPF